MSFKDFLVNIITGGKRPTDQIEVYNAAIDTVKVTTAGEYVEELMSSIGVEDLTTTPEQDQFALDFGHYEGENDGQTS